ncbi:hypothetical protein BRYFOR_09366 [Marvinbryantia formatexigens DSM 14469]|uniref:Uncharacterized protein n=1 Tax=Marvinbryantia formatexigens DSM 14469 TaxID=478749 RepID=C6LL20_9FIRM|nr:hypothetical protein BRYFOR_09366 [Marvinbryantia formatexigens DSM 14469]
MSCPANGPDIDFSCSFLLKSKSHGSLYHKFPTCQSEKDKYPREKNIVSGSTAGPPRYMRNLFKIALRWDFCCSM